MVDYSQHPVTLAIDADWKANQEDGFRNHLGASLAGEDCARKLWYTFRWALERKFDGRILRLFDRGHKEEFRFVEFLRRIGCEVVDINEKGDQFRVVDDTGHYGGSLDGMARFVPGVADCGLMPDTWILTEFKTHNLASFKKLQVDGVKKSKFVHYIQTQEYMFKQKLPLALYMAVNKNDDTLHCEFIHLDIELASKYWDRGISITQQQQPPNRISTRPTWSDCRFCDFKPCCQMGKEMLKNCRTCYKSQPISGGKWYCHHHSAVIPTEKDQMRGCGFYGPIRD